MQVSQNFSNDQSYAVDLHIYHKSQSHEEEYEVYDIAGAKFKKNQLRWVAALVFCINFSRTSALDIESRSCLYAL